MGTRRARLRGILMALAACCAMAEAQASDLPETPAEWLRSSAAGICGLADLTGVDAQLRLPGSWLLRDDRDPPTGPTARVIREFAVPGGDLLRVEERWSGRVLRQFRARYSIAATADEPQPHLLAIADGSCVIRSGRLLRQDGDVWRFLDQLDGDLETLRWSETLQAPWPEGRDPGGVRVGLVDSGLAYDLPLFAGRLARDALGTPLGYDYWDLDPYPYDGDVSRSPFLPIRHGTAVASVLAREAPEAALVPFRYPRPDMGRMADLVGRAEAAGVRILALPLGSNDPADWEAFATAMKGTGMLGIVSAGNNGRDIDARPVWPAALDLDNLIVVTSADGSGRLATGSNWGRRSVDLMLPAENVPVTDFRGAQGVASGSSYAVPRLAALAARLLAAEPHLDAAALKARVLDRAVQSPYEAELSVAIGWIPDPTLP